MQSRSYHHQEDAFILKNDEASIPCRNPCQVLEERYCYPRHKPCPLGLYYFKCGSWTSSLCTIWELVKNVSSRNSSCPAVRFPLKGAWV